MTTTASAWDDQLKALKSRFPTVRDTILFCFQALTQNPDAEIDELKALAHQHGLRVTAASVSGAKTLLARNATPETDETPEPAAPTPTRRPRPTHATVDAETLIRGVVGKLQAQGSADADRLRDAMRKAIALLADAVRS